MYRVQSRVETGLTALVYNNDGKTLRPKLDPLRPYITAHYTGVDVSYGDSGDTEAEIRQIQASAQASGKSNEYNYIIGQDENDIVYEYAGAYQAAHCLGNNSLAYGVLFLNGTKEPLTETQINKFQWLVALLKFVGAVLPNVDVRPHRDMPGAATVCPGPLVMSRWLDLERPYVPTTTPPSSDPYLGCYMKVQEGDSWWSIARRAYGYVTTAIVNDLVSYNDGATIAPGEYVKIKGQHAR